MNISLGCDCGKELRLKPEYAGKKVRCPECQSILFVPSPGFEVVEDDEDEDRQPPRRSRSRPSPDDDTEDGELAEPRRRGRKGARWHGMRRVSIGLGLVLFGELLNILMFAVGFVLGILAAGDADFDETRIPIYALIGLGGQLIAVLLNLVGRIYCLYVPEESGARSLVAWSIGLSLLAPVFEIASLFVDTLPARLLLSVLVAAMNFGAFMTFLNFLVEVAGLLKDAGIKSEAEDLLAFGTAVYGCIVFLRPVMIILLLVFGCFGILGGCTIGIMLTYHGIRFVLQYVHFLHELRGAIESRL